MKGMTIFPSFRTSKYLHSTTIRFFSQTIKPFMSSRASFSLGAAASLVYFTVRVYLISVCITIDDDDQAAKVDACCTCAVRNRSTLPKSTISNDSDLTLFHISNFKHRKPFNAVTCTSNDSIAIQISLNIRSATTCTV